MDERDVKARREQMLKECLSEHQTFETTLRAEDGWKLRIGFVKNIEDGYLEMCEDPLITEEEMLEYHYNFRTVYRLFGMPVIGDYINTNTGIGKIVERTFDVDRKLVEICIL